MIRPKLKVFVCYCIAHYLQLCYFIKDEAPAEHAALSRIVLDEWLRSNK